jgi:hypothetical protein
MNKILVSIFSIFLLTACTQTTEIPTTTNTKEPIATPTKIVKPTITSTPKPTNTDLSLPSNSQSIEIEFEVTFDGNGCTVSGPPEVPIGDYSFLLNNVSGRRVKLVVAQLLDGHTFQDLVDLQSEPGDPFAIEPWMSKPFYYTKDHKIYTVFLDEAGEHGIAIGEYNHVNSWLCAPFQVIETPSE